MKSLVPGSCLVLVLTVACQSGSVGNGVATTSEEVSNPEPEVNADSNQDDDRKRAADTAAREQAKIREAEMRKQARIEAAMERDREAAERWRAGAEERLQAEAERAKQGNEVEEDVPGKHQE